MDDGRAANRTGKARRPVELARASMKMHWRSAAGKSQGGADHRHGVALESKGPGRSESGGARELKL